MCWSASGLFFSKLAVVSFGGAYAVLAYMAQQAVETHHWMTAPEMVDGLGLAETTPGPLILVTQFVGFLAAFRDAAPFSPVTAGVIGAAMTTWVTFVPSMLWIFAGAPFVEQLRANRLLSGALAAITAAVVGVILNLSVWFALHVLFGQVQERHSGWLRWYAFDPLALDLKAAALAVIAAVLAFGFHRGLIEVVAVMAALGIARAAAAGRRKALRALRKLNWIRGLQTPAADCRRPRLRAKTKSGSDAHSRSRPMWVLLIYVVLMIVGDVLDCRHRRGGLEHAGAMPISLPIFLACYFTTLVLAWVIAVRIAESLEADDLSSGRQLASASRVTALSCQRRSARCVSHDSSAKIAMPASDSSSSAANMRGMLSR